MNDKGNKNFYRTEKTDWFFMRVLHLNSIRLTKGYVTIIILYHSYANGDDKLWPTRRKYARVQDNRYQQYPGRVVGDLCPKE